MSINSSLYVEIGGGQGLPPADRTIDVSDKVCPMTFVHTRLALERLAPGQVLAVRLRGEEARRNVPRTSTEQGHQVLATFETENGGATVLIRKDGLKQAAVPA